jgi:hypothetical protein
MWPGRGGLFSECFVSSGHRAVDELARLTLFFSPAKVALSICKVPFKASSNNEFLRCISSNILHEVLGESSKLATNYFISTPKRRPRFRLLHAQNPRVNIALANKKRAQLFVASQFQRRATSR